MATKYEKLARNFKSMIYLACLIIQAQVNEGHALIYLRDKFEKHDQ